MGFIKSVVKNVVMALAAIVLASGMAQAQNNKGQPKSLIKVNIGGPSAGYWVTYVAEEYKIYQKHGIDPQFYWFTSGAPLLAALKNESIDQVVTGLATVFAIGQNIPLKIISWELDNGKGEGLIVSEKSGIASFRDIGKAKAIAAAAGTCSQISLRLMAKKAGVDYSKLNVINLAPPLFANAFTGGSIDAAVGWAPHSINQPQGVRVVSWDADYEGVCPSVNAFRPDFIKKNPDVVERMLKVHAETMDLIKANPQIAINALVKNLKISEVVAKKFYEIHCCSNFPTYKDQLDPNSQFSLTAKEGGLAKQLYVASQVLAEAGTIPRPLTWVEIQNSIDPSYVEKMFGSTTKK